MPLQGGLTEEHTGAMGVAANLPALLRQRQPLWRGRGAGSVHTVFSIPKPKPSRWGFSSVCN